MNIEQHIPTGFEFLPPFEGRPYQGCLHAPGVEGVARLSMAIAVGFGMAMITKNDDVIFDEQSCDNFMELRNFETLAQRDPDHDWRAILEAPLRSMEYQRQGFEKWVLIKSGMGFA